MPLSQSASPGAPPSPGPAFPPEDDRRGIALGVMAYVLWGAFPLYFKAIAEVLPLDVLAWRILLCCVVLLLALLLWKGPRQLLHMTASIGSDWRGWPLIVAAALLISSNWYVFIYAVQIDQVLQSSLGYFLVPIINVALGMLVFGEQPNRLKQGAMLIAVAGMVLTFVVAGVVPLIALFLALTFGLYGMVRKLSSVDSSLGLLLETGILLPLAAVYLVVQAEPLSAYSNSTLFWLSLIGIVTLVPLLAMVSAVRRIRMSTIGFLQYITPCIHYLMAVFYFRETMDLSRTLAFATTLVAVAFWAVGTWQDRRDKNRLRALANDTSTR